MNTKWPALILTLSLTSGWACTSEPDSQRLPRTTLFADAGAEGGGMAGALAVGGHTGDSSSAGRAGEQQASGGGAGAATGAAGSTGGGATGGGAATSGAGQGGETPGPGSAGSSGEAGSGGEAGGVGQPGEPPVGKYCIGCSLMELKTPTWSLTSALMSVAPVGTPASGFDAYYEWLAALYSPNHEPRDGVYGPGIPHAPPYEDELLQLLTAAGITPKQSFTAAEFGGLEQGVTLLFTVVPNALAPHGSSTDFDSGPIIPNVLFPLYIDGDLYRNGVLYDEVFDTFYPGYQSFNPPIEKDGPSHLFLDLGANGSYFPEIEATGNYVFRVSVVDGSLAGWVLDVPFTVR